MNDKERIAELEAELDTATSWLPSFNRQCKISAALRKELADKYTGESATLFGEPIQWWVDLREQVKRADK